MRIHVLLAYFRELWQRRPAAINGIVALILAGLGTFGVWQSSDTSLAGLVFVPLYTVPLMWRRRFPLLVLGWITISLSIVLLQSSFADLPDPAYLAPAIALFIAVYSAMVYGSQEMRIWVCLLSSLTVMGAVMARVAVDTSLVLAPVPSQHVQEPKLLAIWFLCVLLFGVALALGQSVRSHRLSKAAQEENIRRAVERVKLQIAQEIHDSIANYVAIIGLYAGAARIGLRSQPKEELEEILTSIEAMSRTATDESRQMLRMLRTSADETGSAILKPGVGHISDLVDTLAPKGSGLRVELIIYGEPSALPAFIELTVYRIVEEALINIIKHSRATKATVTLQYEANSLEIEILDNGYGRTKMPLISKTMSSGMGLIGIQERVRLCGGELDVGHKGNKGFLVRVKLPLGGESCGNQSAVGRRSPDGAERVPYDSVVRAGH